MTDENLLARAFEESRPHLRAVAFRMLGSKSEADDAVQETWLKLSRTDTSAVENLKAWLTTVTARVCLDMLRSRKARAEEADAPTELERATTTNAEQEAVMADTVSLALLVVLDSLDPAERLAFVLHDLFGVSFEDIANIVGKSEVAARQLASRARRRVRGAPERDDAELARQRTLVDALLAALRAGDVEKVVAVLDPNVVVHAQAPNGKEREIRGARTWANTAVVFARTTHVLDDAVELALVDGHVGAIYVRGGKVSRVLRFGFGSGVIDRVDIMVSADKLRALDIAPLAPIS